MLRKEEFIQAEDIGGEPSLLFSPLTAPMSERKPNKAAEPLTKPELVTKPKAAPAAGSDESLVQNRRKPNKPLKNPNISPTKANKTPGQPKLLFNDTDTSNDDETNSEAADDTVTNEAPPTKDSTTVGPPIRGGASPPNLEEDLSVMDQIMKTNMVNGKLKIICLAHFATIVQESYYQIINSISALLVYIFPKNTRFFL